MNFFKPSRLLPKICLVVFFLAGEGLAAPLEKLVWKDVSLGSAAKGASKWEGKALTLTGAGSGLDQEGLDQCLFTSIECETGDFDFIARVTIPKTAQNVTAGLMVRPPGASPRSSMVALRLESQQNVLGWKSRIPNAEKGKKPRVLGSRIRLKDESPIWLRLVRSGDNFAVFKSRDGKIWANISNTSGGPIALEEPYQIGFFVSSGSRADAASATFDEIRLEKPELGHRTSWVGNTFGSRPQDHHVSNTLSAMWVAPDGTCYTSAYWDEGARPVASYRDGKVMERGVPVGTPRTYEGAITGDANHLYAAFLGHVIQMTPAKDDYAPRPIHLSVNLFDKKKDHSLIGGLASAGGELFVADTEANKIRVVRTDPVETLATAANGSMDIKFAPLPVELPVGDPRFAPAEVYQSQRIGSGIRYQIPGLQSGTEYTVRAHLAAYDKKQAAMVVGSPQETVDVLALAGGPMKALVKDFSGIRANENGELIFAYGGPGGALSGLEVLDQKGESVVAINCGGAPVGKFRGESAELVERAFPFERPGPMVTDKRGNVWIVQRGRDFPINVEPVAKFPAAIKCYRPDGTFAGVEITDVVNPRGLGYDATKDELLVAENGPDLNVRIYSGLEKTPKLSRTLGVPGGIYAGKHPGRVRDPDAGGMARFPGVAGVGADAAGNLYVGGGFQGSDIRMFKPDGELGWMLTSLAFCNTWDVDPDSDGAAIVGTYNKINLDLSRKEPGSEQTYYSYNWDLRRFGPFLRQSQSQSIARRLGPERKLVLFTSGQGYVGDINIFRYEGELAIPCGGTRNTGKDFWVDANGDGLEQPEELTPMQPHLSWVSALAVDSKGDIRTGSPLTTGCFMRHFKFQGFNEHGVPLYNGVKGEGWEDVPFPEEGAATNAWGMACRLDYDAERDILVATYPAAPRQGDADTNLSYFLARYDDWSKGNRSPKWKERTYDPTTHPEYFMYEVDLFPHRGYMGMQIAGDYVFFAYLFGEVHVFDLDTGKLVKILTIGPEVAGQGAWEDAAMGLRAFKRSNGEYLVFTENSGWGGKNNFFRWTPPAKSK